jgi:Skp family chaperone for outer membrane proteins
MKSFQQFNEDLTNLQRNLDALGRQLAPKQRLAARRKAALQKSKLAGDEFNRKSADEVEANKKRMS